MRQAALYGVGMALTLTGIGLMLVRAGDALGRWMHGHTTGWGRRLLRTVPMVAALAVTAGGMALVVRGVAQM